MVAPEFPQKYPVPQPKQYHTSKHSLGAYIFEHIDKLLELAEDYRMLIRSKVPGYEEYLRPYYSVLEGLYLRLRPGITSRAWRKEIDGKLNMLYVKIERHNRVIKYTMQDIPSDDIDNGLVMFGALVHELMHKMKLGIQMETFEGLDIKMERHLLGEKQNE